MYLDYSTIKSGQIKQPVLRLKTLAGKNLGAIPNVNNLKFDINYADVSEISFDVPYMSDGVVNYLYGELTSYKVIYTENFGIYILTSPKKSGDGVGEVKTIHGYSLEKLFEKKRLFLEEGTYDFWNPAHPNDTILGRIIETDDTWSVGYIDPKLIGCYRTFDEYDSDPLTFCYSNAAEKYQCVVVFDVYNRTINAYDASRSRGMLPIYLSYDNLVESVGVDEVTDEIVTKLRVYGADDFTIRDVNPIGADYLIDLSYFIANGDLDIKIEGSNETLAERVASWQTQITANRGYYTGLIAAKSSKTAQAIVAKAELNALNNELEGLMIEQSVIIQALALETSDSGRATQQANLDSKNTEIANKRSEIQSKEDDITAIDEDISSYTNDIVAFNSQYSFNNFFTKAERDILNQYLIEDEVTEETFVATDVDTSVSGAISTISGDITISDSSIERITVSGKSLYTIAGGVFDVDDSESDSGIVADIVRGTLEVDTAQDSYVLTLYLGATTYIGHDFPSGMVTMSGEYSALASDVTIHNDNGITEYIGSEISLITSDSSIFFTVNVNEYQKYSVAQELYDYGAEVLNDKAWPIYEFQLSSGNFLFQKEFEPFKNKLELGKGVHLALGSDGNITANIIGISIGFEKPTDFRLTFSNRFQLRNLMENWVDKIEAASSSSRGFDANKYIYNRAANKTTQVSQFMEGQLDAAVNTIVGARNQSVLINGAGVHIGESNSPYQMRIVNNMIAMTDDGWESAKLAIGRFATEDTGEQWGVNAEMIAGKLIVGNNMVLENATDNGTMMFKVDASGAWLYNSRFILQQSAGGQILIDPSYGIVAGNGNLYTVSGTTVIPSFIDENEDIILDSDGMPENSSFYIDINTGDAYFRGKLKATSGQIGGFTIEDDYLHAGSGSSYVALNGSGSNTNSAYAIWAGSSNPASANFSVRKNGKIYAEGGTFGGTITASTITGRLSAGSGSSNAPYIGDWRFTDDALYNGSLTTYNGTGNGICVSTSGIGVRRGSSYAYMSSTGKLYANNAEISGDITAQSVQGSAVRMLSDDGRRVGTMAITNASGYDGLKVAINSSGAISIEADRNTFISGDGAFFNLEDGWMNVGGEGICPTQDATKSCGSGFYRWDDVWSQNPSCNTSDRNLKRDINYDLSPYDAIFDDLKPVSYKFIDGTSGRTHIGMISQDVEESLTKYGMSGMDFAAFLKDKAEDGFRYGLRYGEFIGLLVDQVQKLKGRVQELETKIKN